MLPLVSARGMSKDRESAQSAALYIQVQRLLRTLFIWAKGSACTREGERRRREQEAVSVPWFNK